MLSVFDVRVKFGPVLFSSCVLCFFLAVVCFCVLKPEGILPLGWVDAVDPKSP